MPFYSLRKGTPLPPSMLTIILSRFRTSIVFFLKNSDLIITFLLYLCSCYYFYLASFYIYFIVLNFIFYSSKVIDRQLRFKAHFLAWECFYCNFDHDTECWEPGRAMYVSLTEGAFLKLTFQLFVWLVFICSTHSVEMLSKERHPESTDVPKFSQYALTIYCKLCVDISSPFHSQDFHINSPACHIFFILLVLTIWC